MLFFAQCAQALSFTGTNPAAVNMVKYRQQNYYKKYNQPKTNYIYSEQQARYYGIRTPNNAYQYRQNYTNNRYRY